MIVYLITNMVNGKKYVGQTTRPVEDRWNEHVKYALNNIPGSPYLYAAMRKYGPENFVCETVCSASSLEELDQKEEEWIKTLGTFGSGYNLNSGGSHPPMSAETRNKISSTLLGRPSPFKGVPIPPERYEKIKASGVWERSSTNMSEESRKRLSESRKGENNPNFGGKGMTREGIQKVADILRIKYCGKGNPMFRQDISTESAKQLRSIGFSYEKIGKYLGCSGTTIKNRLKSWCVEHEAA